MPTTVERTPFAARLRAMRKGKGLTQAALATKAELSPSVVAQLEQGYTGDPKLSTIQQLAKALEVEVCELLGGVAPVDTDTPRRRPKKEG
jgi:transcriptional regulator with XRE-family HTH domain